MGDVVEPAVQAEQDPDEAAAAEWQVDQRMQDPGVRPGGRERLNPLGDGDGHVRPGWYHFPRSTRNAKTRAWPPPAHVRYARGVRDFDAELGDEPCWDRRAEFEWRTGGVPAVDAGLQKRAEGVLVREWVAARGSSASRGVGVLQGRSDVPI